MRRSVLLAALGVCALASAFAACEPFGVAAAPAALDAGGADAEGGSGTGPDAPLAELPLRAVVPFDKDADGGCPDGWLPMDTTGGTADARGRMIVGTGGSLVLHSTGGSTERVLVGEPAVPTFTDSTCGGSQTTGYGLGAGCGSDVHAYSQALSIRMPYVAMLMCMKASTARGLPDTAVVAMESTCPPGFDPLDGAVPSRPDMRGRMIIGADGRYPAKSVGGAATITLRPENLPWGYVDDVTCPGGGPTQGNRRGQSCGEVAGRYNAPIDLMNPYVVFPLCEAHGLRDGVPSGAVVDFDQAECPPEWSAVADVDGRVSVGAGGDWKPAARGGASSVWIDPEQMPGPPKFVSLDGCAGGDAWGHFASGSCGNLGYDQVALDITNPYIALTRCRKN